MLFARACARTQYRYGTNVYMTCVDYASTDRQYALSRALVIIIIMIESEKMILVAQKIIIVSISAVENTKHTDYSDVLALVIVHSFTEL